MKEHPILFSPVMVEAIQEGRKTMTRREIKPQPVVLEGQEIVEVAKNDFWIGTNNGHFSGHSSSRFKSKYQVGDRLWVKETHFLFGAWVRNGVTSAGKEKWRFTPNELTEVRYLDNPPKEFKTSRDKENPGLPKWYKRNSLFMPKWASRITLEVTAVRAEKLNKISDDDANNEGVITQMISPAIFNGGESEPEIWESPCDAFIRLWKSINGPESWKSNPYVWVITFKKINQ